jgi:hypothetical protein
MEPVTEILIAWILLPRGKQPPRHRHDAGARIFQILVVEVYGGLAIADQPLIVKIADSCFG